MYQSQIHNSFGHTFISFHEIDSTNNYALKLINERLAQSGMIIFAQHQTAGKGQWGKTWLSEKFTSFSFSLIYNPEPLLTAEIFRLNMAVSLAVCEFYQSFLQSLVCIKWPNDIYFNGKKAGGILIENKITGEPSQWNWAVAGIGLNINQPFFPAELQQATSLKIITGKEYNTFELAADLARFLEKNINQLQNGNFGTILTEYNKRLFKINETVKLKKGSRIFDAEILGVNAQGMLMAKNAIIEEYAHGEVQWVI